MRTQEENFELSGDLLRLFGDFCATVEPHYFRIYRCKLHPAK